jgi:hypothetical protein
MWNLKFLYGGPLWRSWKKIELTCHNVKCSWLIMFKQTRMLFTLCLAHHETLPNHCITKKELSISIGFNPWSFTTIVYLNHIWEQNTWKFATTTRVPKHLMKRMQILRLSSLGGIHLEYDQGKTLKTLTIGCHCILAFISGQIFLEMYLEFCP